MYSGLPYLVAAITILRQKGYVSDADRLQKVVDDLVVGEDQGLNDILNSYARMHRVDGGTRQKVVVAVIRKGTECPFGLPIPAACTFAGDSVEDMHEGPHKVNKMIYNTERDHSCCKFSDGLMEGQGAVNCTYGGVLQGQKHMKMFHGNPQYPKMWSGFSGIALDRGYHAYSQQYGNELFPYPSIYG